MWWSVLRRFSSNTTLFDNRRRRGLWSFTPGRRNRFETAHPAAIAAAGSFPRLCFEPIGQSRVSSSATRSALATIVRAGFTLPLVGCTDASPTIICLAPCGRHRRSVADVAGSHPVRAIPQECSRAANAAAAPYWRRISCAPAACSHGAPTRGTSAMPKTPNACGRPLRIRSTMTRPPHGILSPFPWSRVATEWPGRAKSVTASFVIASIVTNL